MKPERIDEILDVVKDAPDAALGRLADRLEEMERAEITGLAGPRPLLGPYLPSGRACVPGRGAA